MRLRYRQLRLRIPSMNQGNSSAPKACYWCGRTSASMIHNYYLAARAGSIEAARDQMIINQRDRAPYELVHPDGSLSAPEYDLIGEIRKIKPTGWSQIPDYPASAAKMYPKAGRGDKPSEQQIRKILAGLLRSLEMFNPALAYTSLSASTSEPRHIVVFSGYKIGPDGRLWLHVDDPGRTYKPNKPLTSWNTATFVQAGVNEPVIEQRRPDTDETISGIRYWLRADRLFDPNHHSARTDDLWCDHSDRDGLAVWFNDQIAEDESPLVLTASQRPGLPVDLRDPAGNPAQEFEAAYDNARTSGAPFPLGTNRAWHNGIHFHHDKGVFKSTDVVSMAPGELVLVRFPVQRGTQEHAGTVLIRHALDPATLRILDLRPKPGTEPASTPEPIWIYSLYMHMFGGESGAAKILDRLGLGDEPAYRVFLPAPGTCELFGYDPDDTALELAAESSAGHEIASEATVEVETSAGPRRAPVVGKDQTNVAAWEDGKPQAPTADVETPLGLFDHLSRSIVTPHERGEKGPGAAASLATATPLEVVFTDEGQWEFVVADTRQPGGPFAKDAPYTWVPLAETPYPGVQLRDTRHCLHDSSERPTFEAVPDDCALLFLRKGKAAMTVSSGGKEKKGTLTITFPASGGEPFWCSSIRNHPATKPDATDGAAAWPVLDPCVAVDEKTKKDLEAATDPVAPSKAKLCYRNPATNHVLSTNVSIAGVSMKCRGALRYTDDGRYALLDGHAPKLAVPHALSCVHDHESSAALLKYKRRAWPLLTLLDETAELYTRTTGAGGRRQFPDDSRVVVSLRGRPLQLAEGPVKTGGRMRAWLKLSLCAGLDDAVYEAKQQALEDAFSGPEAATLGRLQTGQSRLFGIQLGSRDEWVVTDGVAHMRDDFSGAALRLFSAVAGKGRSRSFPEQRGDEVDPVRTIPADPNIRLRVVTAFTSGGKYKRSRALVEICPAAMESKFTDNQDEIDAWHADATFVQQVREEVTSGDVVDLAALSASHKSTRTGSGLESWRFVGRDPIGTLGKAGPLSLGLHFEIFAGENILPSDGPIGGWREVRVDSEPLDDPFYAEVMAEILRDGTLAQNAREERDGTGTVASALKGYPVPADQWLRFCALPENDQALSQIIATHKTEWAMDWESAASANPRIRGTYEDLGPVTGWWPDGLDLPGLVGDDWLFYHPLRLLEWLTTGIEARVLLATEKSAGMRVTLSGETFDLAASDADEEDEVFRIRTVMPGGKPELSTELTLEGVDTTVPTIPITLARGELLQLWLCEPTAGMEAENRPPSLRTGVPYTVATALHTEEDDPNTGDPPPEYLLADGAPHLSTCGLSRATFLVETVYNVEAPEKLALEIDNAAATISLVELRGAEPPAEDETWGGTTYTIALKPTGPPPSPLTMYSKITARVDVVVDNTIGVDASLQFEVTGGELLGPVASACRIATRVIKAGALGRDVAKLQLYLHQYRAEGKPCYEGEIDGQNGPGTAEALWRFILHYCTRPTWDREFSEVATDGQARSLDPFEAVPAGKLCTEAENAYTVNGHPEVGEQLLAELVRHYGMPSVLPAIGLAVATPDVAGAPKDVLGKLGVAGRTALFPAPGLAAASNHVDIDVALLEPAVPGDPAAVPVTLRLSAGTPYALTGAEQRTLASLLSEGIRLEPNGIESAKKETCRLQLVGPDGVILASRDLGGTRNLLKVGGSSRSYDALQLQVWLSQFPHPDTGVPFYTKGIDGQWGSGSGKALTKFAGLLAPEEPYAEVLARLAAGPSASNEEEAAQ